MVQGFGRLFWLGTRNVERGFNFLLLRKCLMILIQESFEPDHLISCLLVHAR